MKESRSSTIVGEIKKEIIDLRTNKGWCGSKLRAHINSRLKDHPDKDELKVKMYKWLRSSVLNRNRWLD